MDDVEWVAADVALGKAYTAAAFQAPSADLAERSAAVPLLAQSMMTMTGGRFVPQNLASSPSTSKRVSSSASARPTTWSSPAADSVSVTLPRSRARRPGEIQPVTLKANEVYEEPAIAWSV